MNNAWWIAFVVLALLVGLAGGFALDKEVVCDEPIVCADPEVVIINQTVEVEVEVDSSLDLLDSSILLFIEELDDADRLSCGGIEYDDDELSVRKVFDKFNIEYDDDDKAIDFKVKLKYNDGDDRCYKTWNVNVIYEDGEDPEFDYSVII